MRTIKERLLKFDSFLARTNDIFFVLSFIPLMYLIAIPGYFLGELILNIFNLNHGIFSQSTQSPVKDTFLIVYASLIAPPLETILGQMLPIGIASKFTKRISKKIFFAGLIFSLLHLPVIGFLPTSFLIGALLAWAYVIKRRQSKWKAFLLTTIIHSLHNTLATLIFLKFG